MAWATGAFAKAEATADSAATVTAKSGSVEGLFAKALTHFSNRDFATALALFENAAQLTESPNVRLYIGYCYSELGQPQKAYQAFGQTIQLALRSRDAKYKAASEAAQGQLDIMSLRSARLTISLVEGSRGYTVKLDNQTVDSTLLGSPIVVKPGVHHVDAVATGMKPLSRELALDAGSTKTITLMFERDEVPAPDGRDVSGTASNSSTKTLGWISGGLGVAGLGVFAVAGLKARVAFNQLHAECGGGCTDPNHASQIDSGKSYQTLANVGLGIGAVGVLAGATLLYFGYRSEAGAKPAIELSANRAFVGYQGSF